MRMRMAIGSVRLPTRQRTWLGGRGTRVRPATITHEKSALLTRSARFSYRLALMVSAVIVAVGTSSVLRSVPVASAAHTPGTTWASEPVPSGLDGFVPSSVSCTGSHCVSVAFYCPVGGCGGLNPSAILVSSDRGRTWVSEPVPAQIEQLGSVSCSSSRNCEATGTHPGVGTQFESGATGAVLVTADGGANWSAVLVPGTTNLSSISCPSTSRCFAVSGSVSANGTFVTGVVATADGGANWMHETLPADIGGLDGLSCPSMSVCYAFGVTSDLSAAVIVATFDGGKTWATAAVLSGVANVFGMSCPSTSRCFAVGVTATTSGAPTIVATSDGGSTWVNQPVPAGVTFLRGIACPRTSVCFAVGGSSSTLSMSAILTTDTGGRVWTSESPVSEPSVLADVSCYGDAGCVAVGDWYTYNGFTYTDNGPLILNNGP